MIFTSIPKNGASWQKPLLYSFEFADGSYGDMEVEIYNCSTNALIGKRLIRSVQAATIDIAPYIRSVIPVELTEADEPKIVRSPSAISVSISVNGTSSEQLIFYRGDVDLGTSHIISEMPKEEQLSLGETIRLSLYGQRTISVTYTATGPTSQTSDTIGYLTLKQPAELVIPTSQFAADTKLITVEVSCESRPIASYKIHIVDPTPAARRIAWYNENGGIECYTFRLSRRLTYEASEPTSGNREVHRALNSRIVKRRLYASTESATELERLATAIYSPELYLCNKGFATPLCLLERKIKFDEHDKPNGLYLDIEEMWKGGAR